MHSWFRDEVGLSMGKRRWKRGRCAFDAKIRGRRVGPRARERLPSGRAGLFSHLTRPNPAACNRIRVEASPADEKSRAARDPVARSTCAALSTHSHSRTCGRGAAAPSASSSSSTHRSRSLGTLAPVLAAIRKARAALSLAAFVRGPLDRHVTFYRFSSLLSFCGKVKKRKHRVSFPYRSEFCDCVNCKLLPPRALPDYCNK